MSAEVICAAQMGLGSGCGCQPPQGGRKLCTTVQAAKCGRFRCQVQLRLLSASCPCVTRCGLPCPRSRLQAGSLKSLRCLQEHLGAKEISPAETRKAEGGGAFYRMRKARAVMKHRDQRSLPSALFLLGHRKARDARSLGGTKGPSVLLGDLRTRGVRVGAADQGLSACRVGGRAVLATGPVFPLLG